MELNSCYSTPIVTSYHVITTFKINEVIRLIERSPLEGKRLTDCCHPGFFDFCASAGNGFRLAPLAGKLTTLFPLDLLHFLHLSPGLGHWFRSFIDESSERDRT